MAPPDTAPIIPIRFSIDGYTLKGYLHLPPHAAKPPVVIGSHGLFSDGGSPKQIALAAECNRLGLAFFRFHHRGCGESAGDFETATSLENRCRDLRAAIELLRARPETGNRCGIFGSSIGGATALSLCSGYPVDALVTLAAPVCSAPILAAAKKTGDLRGMSVSFYEERLTFDLSASLPLISRILVIHGEDDQVVPVSNAYAIHAGAAEPKRLIIQPHGDHQVTHPEHQTQFIREAGAWFACRLR
ncbi:MAG: alpha/beta hydrolase [Thermodesulfobacteriota bacterium]